MRGKAWPVHSSDALVRVGAYATESRRIRAMAQMAASETSETQRHDYMQTQHAVLIAGMVRCTSARAADFIALTALALPAPSGR